MDRPGYFQTALSNFAMDAACGGAVRHLTDLGYTLDQIVERLDYPAPRAKVRQIMMEYLYDSRVLLREEPSGNLFAARAEFIQEQDAYGRRTLRRISGDQDSQNKMTNMPGLTIMSPNEKKAKEQEIIWRESKYNSRRDGKLTELLFRKSQENGETFSYVSCSFAFLNIDQNGYSMQKESKHESEKSIACLNNRQREYLQGIQWEHPVIYHRLNQRMLEIIGKLYEAGVYGGVCFFMKGQEKLVIESLAGKRIK